MQYLFERLYDPARRTTAGEPDPRDLVRDQLQRLAWTSARERDGSANVVPFGMPSVLDVHSDMSLKRYAQSLQRLIERHEPRLRDVSVALERTEDLLEPYRLAVSGVLAGGQAPELLSFTLSLPGA
jgi:predicted component of type VI protein secretion system